MRPCLPEKLNRRAVIRCFNRLSEARWLYLFRIERKVGLYQYRVTGHYRRNYYKTDGLIQWLISEGYYLPEDFGQSAHAQSWNSLPAMRQHRMAG